MNRRVLPFFLFLLGWIALGCWLCKKFLCDATPKQVISQSTLAPAAASGWTIADGSGFTTNSPDYFGYAHNGTAHTGMSPGLETSVASTATYLKGNPDRSLDITGYYMDSETNNSILPTLGLARANDIKDLFVNSGVPVNQLNLKDALLPEAAWANDTHVTRGIELAFTGKVANDTRLADIKARLFGKPITLYFGTNDANIALSSQQRTDMADIMYYLDRVPESGLGIGGHTDNRGGRRANLKLSESRAASVRDYLAQKGLSASRMTAKGYGPEQPIASNDDDAGRAQNRRVEVILK